MRLQGGGAGGRAGAAGVALFSSGSRPSTTPGWRPALLPLLLAPTSHPHPPARYNLYLASWGYCTDEERAAAARLPGVRVLALPQFCELLRWGVVMGVSACARMSRAERRLA